MTTKLVGIKDFRKNITSLWRDAQKKQIRYVVMYHSRPILEVSPLSSEEIVLEELAGEIAEARRQVRQGKVYTQAETYKRLGL
ncbi:hypothetical protein COT40_00705 [Candidatus Peregrinibacteria bacterium CG08_land_8_20_14_0_20_41_10]|nr:MAG: hypothetical protein COT40_00705 [Candidatus Peregrinibacteria bacterium CG08_land_8_20_14_0_20_41_10]